MRLTWGRGLRMLPPSLRIIDDPYVPAPSFEMLEVYIAVARWLFAEGRRPGFGVSYSSAVPSPYRETRMHCRLQTSTIQLSAYPKVGGPLDEAGLWLTLEEVDGVPWTWIQKLNPLRVDHFEDLIGILETLEFDGNRYGEYWEPYQPNHPWPERDSA